MPLKKKKYNARFPAGRIKKIMQTDEEVGKVAQAVPIIISRTLELFVESLLKKTIRITTARNAKTLSPSHMKQCIMSENRFDFLRELVKTVPDINIVDELSFDSTSTCASDNSLMIGQHQQLAVTPTLQSATLTTASIVGNTVPVNGSTLSVTRNPSSGSLLDESLKQELDVGIVNDLPITAVSEVSIDGITTVAATTMATSPPPLLSFRVSLANDSLEPVPTVIRPNFYNELPIRPDTPQQPDPAPTLYQNPQSITLATISSQIAGNIANATATASSSSSSAASMLPITSEPLLPALVQSPRCDVPVVKIDYSNMALLHAGKPINSISTSSTVGVGVAIDVGSSTSKHQSTPTTQINVHPNKDLTSFKYNTQSGGDAINIMVSTPNLDMDEDYDNL